MRSISLLVPTDRLETNVKGILSSFTDEFGARKNQSSKAEKEFYYRKLSEVLCQIGRIQTSDKWKFYTKNLSTDAAKKLEDSYHKHQDAFCFTDSGDYKNKDFNLVSPTENLATNIDLALRRIEIDAESMSKFLAHNERTRDESLHYECRLKEVLDQLGRMQFAIKKHFNVK